MNFFDLHCDTFTKLYDKKLTLLSEVTAVGFTGLSKYRTAVQTFAVFLRKTEIKDYERYDDCLKYGKAELERCGIKLCEKPKDIASCGVKALLSLEGGIPCGTAESVEKVFSDGIKTVSLTWNYDNMYAGGVLENGGLTALGRETLREMNRYGMCLDVSHLNKKSLTQAVFEADTVAATHTGVRKVIDCPRNLDDESLCLIRDKGGLVGLTVYPAFVGDDPYEGFFRTVVHCLNMGLEDCIGIGSDFDGAEMSKRLDKTDKMPSLYTFLRKKGLESTLCDKIFFENSAEFYRNVLTKCR